MVSQLEVGATQIVHLHQVNLIAAQPPKEMNPCG